MEDQGLSKKEVERALKLEGYGRKAAPYWFIGMEEGGGSIEELRKRARLFDPVEDLRLAHEKIGWKDMYRHVPTWRVMSKLVMAMQGTCGWQETSSAREYQANMRGRADGDTFLTELMPLPSPSTAVWPYESIFPTRDEYYAAVRPGRIERLRSEFLAFHPCFVICYGKGNWNHYEKIFCDVEFRPKLNEKIRVGRRGRSTILLLPFLFYYHVTPVLIKRLIDLCGRKLNEAALKEYEET
ncbi:MAG: hypothetical protein QF714_03305 [Dehalococcoidia bacterium]|jgi:hypothetical protein|nr:hypothetical protein [Dehalococcoidia bacterium]